MFQAALLPLLVLPTALAVPAAAYDTGTSNSSTSATTSTTTSTTASTTTSTGSYAFTDATLYAYGTNISGTPLVFGDDGKTKTPFLSAAPRKAPVTDD